MEWTNEQKRIIDIRKSNILVSAAAGSGKTAVLVERIIKLVKDENVDIDKFLVVTFTNAAAAGMKQKIQKALVKAAQEEANMKHIRKQLSLLNRAQITTIHSFCLDVVRKNFHIIGLDPNFRIGDTSEISILLQESISEVLERAYSKNNLDFSNLVERFTGNRGDDELSKILTKLYYFILSFPDPLQWLEDSVNHMNLTEDEFIDSIWYKETRQYVDMKLDGAIDILKVGINICREKDGPKLYEETLKQDLAILDELKIALRKDLMTFVRYVSEFKAPTIKRYKKDDTSLIDVNEEKQTEIKDKLRQEYKDVINSLKDIFPYDSIDKYVEDINYMYSSIAALKDLIIDLDETYKKKKIEKSLVDFNDLEHYALEIFRNKKYIDDSTFVYQPSEVANSYKNKLSYIFIDEYQDSNSIQEAIIDQIKGNDNLFMVGDVKQSIYRFRLADPSIFNEKYNLYDNDRETLDKNSIHRVIELNKNFRSRKEILDATNYVFSNIMTSDLGEIDYSENVYLNNGNIFPNENPVELDIIHKSQISAYNEDNADMVDDEIESIQTAEIEALYAAGKIKTILGKDTYDANVEGSFRKIDYKDIVILLRSVANWSNIFEEVFNREGIPFYFDGGAGYYDTIEIQVLVNLLRLIDNIRQDIPLISVMRSPIGRITSEELIEIRASYPHDRYIDACNKFIEKIKTDSAKDDFSINLSNKLNAFMNQILDWTDRNTYTHLSDLIWEIMMESSYYDFVGVLPNGKLRQANLRLLADKAYDFEKTSMRGLFKFLRYIEKLNSSSQTKTSTAKTLGANDNVVRLMTIHSSKGLEFPVVILCGLNKQFSLEDSKPKILMHKDYGIGTKYINEEDRIEKDTLSRLAIIHKMKFENLSEEMRILYVAMTRAIDKLIMVGTIKGFDEKIRKWRKGHSKYFIYKGRSYLDWIGSCLFENKTMEDLDDIFSVGIIDDFKIGKISYSDLLQGDDRQEVKATLEDKIRELEIATNQERLDEIGKLLSFGYNYENSIKTPTKLSVTEINNMSEEKFKKLRYKIPTLSNMPKYDEKGKSFILENKKLSGADIGTLLHLVMEHIDISVENLHREEIVRQITEITKKNLLSELESGFIIKNYADKIEALYNSEIGIRMKNSPFVKREAPFVIKKEADRILNNLNKEDTILVQGIIDCYFYEGDDIVLVDYKTDSVNEDNLDLLKSEYRQQIAYYKEAIQKITKKQVKESYLYLFSKGILLSIN